MFNVGCGFNRAQFESSYKEEPLNSGSLLKVNISRISKHRILLSVPFGSMLKGTSN